MASLPWTTALMAAGLVRGVVGTEVAELVAVEVGCLAAWVLRPVGCVSVVDSAGLGFELVAT